MQVNKRVYGNFPDENMMNSSQIGKRMTYMSSFRTAWDICLHFAAAKEDGQRKGQKIHFYKVNDKLNSPILNNIINGHRCKTNSLLCKINVHKIIQRYLNTNQTKKVKPTDINVKRTYINMKQADAQIYINARWRS